MHTLHVTSKTNVNNGYTCAVIYKNQMLLFASGCSLFLFVIGKTLMQQLVMFISVFNYQCLMGCSSPEMPRCWHVGGLGKLFTFCLPDS